MNLNIRPATAADQPCLAAWLARQADPPPLSEPALLAETDDRLLGWLSYQVSPSGIAPARQLDWIRSRRACWLAQWSTCAQEPRYVRLQRLVTEPDSAATAAALLDHLSAHLAAESITQLRVTVAAADAAQCARYQELGFTPSLWLFQRPLPLSATTDPAPRIRPATRRDLPALTTLLVDYITGEEQRADFFRLRPDADWRRLAVAKWRCRDRILLVADREGPLAGFIDVSLTPSTLGYMRSLARWGWNWLRGHRAAPPVWRRIARVEGIYTTPDQRRHGVAAALLHHAAARAVRQGAAVLHAPIWAVNHTSQAFCRRQGLTPTRLVLRRRCEEGQQRQ